MMDLTDRHARYMLRLISQHSLLYTEMVTVEALLHGDLERLIGFHSAEHPLALQLGGSDPVKLARCVQIAAKAGYDEVNLNVGCPSDRVQSGQFGACLMLQAELVAECYQAMAAASDLPITIKCRLGVDEQEPGNTLPEFIGRLASAGCSSFSIHARKAWLQGLSPKQNRSVPPLDYPLVYSIKKQYPNLCIVINGGIESLADAEGHLDYVDGVMLGRKAYYEPWTLSKVDRLIFDDDAVELTRRDVFDGFLGYVEKELGRGTALKHMSKHVLGLFHGEPGARRFRRHISEQAYKKDAGIEVLVEAVAMLESH